MCSIYEHLNCIAEFILTSYLFWFVTIVGLTLILIIIISGLHEQRRFNKYQNEYQKK